MTQEQREWLFYTVWWASRGDELAKRTLWELLLTDRKRIILSKLGNRNVRESDREDAHSNIALKIYNNIEQLKITRAYIRWEERLICSECQPWRRDYAILIDLQETTEIEGNYEFWEELE